jgi:hypothetical protein
MFLTPTLRGREWSALHSGLYNPGKLDGRLGKT